MMNDRRPNLAKIHEAAERAALEVAQWPAWKREASTPKVVSYESALAVAAREDSKSDEAKQS